MEINPASPDLTDALGRLRQRHELGQSILDALPPAQPQQIGHAIQARPSASTGYAAVRAHHAGPTPPSWTSPGRDTFAPVQYRQRLVRRRRMLAWWQRWLLVALRWELRLQRWMRKRQQRRQRLQRLRHRPRPR